MEACKDFFLAWCVFGVCARVVVCRLFTGISRARHDKPVCFGLIELSVLVCRGVHCLSR